MSSVVRSRIALLGPPRRTGIIVEARTQLGDSNRPVDEHRIELDDSAGSVWVTLTTTPHELMQSGEELDAGTDVQINTRVPEKLTLRCVLTFQPLVDPARGVDCSHASNANFDDLASHVMRSKQCPVFGCDCTILRGRSSIRRDINLKALLQTVPPGREHVWLCDGGTRLQLEAPQQPTAASRARTAAPRTSTAAPSLPAGGSQRRSRAAAAASSTAAAAAIDIRDASEAGDEVEASGGEEVGGEDGAHDDTNAECAEEPAEEPAESEQPRMRKRRKLSRVWVQCDAQSCGKWRRLPAGERVGRGRWECRLHPDPAFASCEAPQEELVSDEEEGAVVEDEEKDQDEFATYAEASGVRGSDAAAAMPCQHACLPACAVLLAAAHALPRAATNGSSPHPPTGRASLY